MRNRLNLKSFTYQNCQELTVEHKQQRKKNCNWFLENGFDPQSVIFSDEKWFSLTLQQNRQNTQYWNEANMHLYKPS